MVHHINAAKLGNQKKFTIFDANFLLMKLICIPFVN